MSRTKSVQTKLPTEIERLQSRGARTAPPPVVDTLPLAECLLEVLDFVSTDSTEYAELYNRNKGPLEAIIRKWRVPQ